MKYWQDKFIKELPDGKYVCYDERGGTLTIKDSIEQARKALLEYSLSLEGTYEQFGKD